MALEEDEHSVLHAAWQAVCSMNIQGWIGVALVEQQQDVICRQAIGPSAAAKAVISSGRRLLQLLHTGRFFDLLICSAGSSLCNVHTFTAIGSAGTLLIGGLSAPAQVSDPLSM